MITNLKIQNFKSLKDINLELKNLNLLTGLNGSGKSSLIQVLLLLRQSKNTLNEGILSLQKEEKELFDAGVAQDVYYSQSKDNKISFHLTFSNNIFKWDFNYSREKNQIDDTLEGARHYKMEELNKFDLFNDNFQYLYAERLKPQDNYTVSMENVVKKSSLGTWGEHTAFYLETHGLSKEININLQHPKSKSEQLLYQTEAWLKEISPNVNIQTELNKNKDEIKLFFEYGIYKYKPKHVGFGLSYALPVIVALLTAEKDKLIIIENPESHIHPRGQAELGRLIALATQTEAQIIIETHSDHILNGIRVAVKEKPEIRSKVSILFHDRINENEEQYTQITPIKIDKNGELSDYPKNFLDEWTNQLIKLV